MSYQSLVPVKATYATSPASSPINPVLVAAFATSTATGYPKVCATAYTIHRE